MKPRGTQRKLKWTAADRERHRAIREFCERERPGPDQLTAGGRYEEPLPLEAYMAFRQAVLAVKAERERRGLSLDEVAQASGIHKASLSRLETGKLVNPTIDLLLRYTAAVECRLTWNVEGIATPGVANGMGKKARA
jgi:DNA-binding XRE family transcriptional regulator